MHRKANGCCHLTFRQFFIDEGSREATERAAAMFFRRGHAHQAKFAHLVVDFAGKVISFVPFFRVRGNFLFGEATDRVANI